MKSFIHIVFAAALSLLFAVQAMAAEKVNINTADAAALDRVLIGVGPAKAAAIIEYRKANGPFKSAEELAMVKGIGLSTIEQNRDRIELRTGTAPAGKPAGKPAAAAATPAKPVARR
ncbi:helix-hairpin-helix domain-containing protein [Pseudoxanthomonas sp.]|jgi:competence protein ComEA helix-hairpin-helix repeat region|uniref:ComEA family DNA-binding protein n=1 Tax=Pseudoxanthomonas sp. TaxID=1871049 RepID=UPI002FE2ED6E